MSGVLHDDELPVDVPLVRALVDRARPAYAGLSLAPLRASGSTNALFRLGEQLLVRLPRQPGGTATILKEARWLPVVGPRLPVDVPDIVEVGEPGFGYPERWSIVRWLDGATPPVVGVGRRVGGSLLPLARDLAGVVRALREIEVPPEAEEDPELHWYRGGPLAWRDGDTRRAVEACRAIEELDLDLDAVLAVWEEAMGLPGVGESGSTRWYHGDLLAENLLVRDGRLAAVLDFGGLAVGDPTVDLIAAWEVLDPPARDAFREAVEVDEPAWLRGRAWALSLAMITFPYYWRSMPERCAGRLAIARSVLEDAGR
jgi:aminoglycoside phosphotransferase (APT) family kinase protein